MDLRHSLIPDDLIEDLLHSMPKHNGPDFEVDRNVPKYDYIGFMERIADGDQDQATQTAPTKNRPGTNGHTPTPSISPTKRDSATTLGSMSPTKRDSAGSTVPSLSPTKREFGGLIGSLSNGSLSAPGSPRKENARPGVGMR
jgi:Ca2+ insensitive EF hand